MSSRTASEASSVPVSRQLRRAPRGRPTRDNADFIQLAAQRPLSGSSRSWLSSARSNFRASLNIAQAIQLGRLPQLHSQEQSCVCWRWSWSLGGAKGERSLRGSLPRRLSGFWWFITGPLHLLDAAGALAGLPEPPRPARLRHPRVAWDFTLEEVGGA